MISHYSEKTAGVNPRPTIRGMGFARSHCNTKAKLVIKLSLKTEERSLTMINDFFKYCLHDGDIEKIEISSNSISIIIQHDDYEKSIKILCNDVVGLTNLCMWEDTIINNATLEYVNGELSPFLQEVKDAHPLNGEFYDNQPIKNKLLCLSIALVNDIVFNIYCYSVEIYE